MLSIISVLGIVQSFLLGFFFFKRRGSGKSYQLLSGLFGILAVSMMLIVLSEVVVHDNQSLFEIVEFSLTLSAGPILYLVSMNLLGKSLGRKEKMIHFMPAVLYLMMSGLSSVDDNFMPAIHNLPIMVAVIHMQVYTVWVSIYLVIEYAAGNITPDSHHKWIFTVLIVLITIHVAQWTRFFYAHLNSLVLIVPATAFLSVYVLVMYRLWQSNEHFKVPKTRKKLVLDDEEVEKLVCLFRKIMDVEKVYQNPTITLEEFSRIAGEPAYKISYVLNQSLHTGFNEWINSYRIENVKHLLLSPSKGHLTIEAIASEAGFKSRSVFYRAFKRETGMTPVQFRKRKNYG